MFLLAGFAISEYGSISLDSHRVRLRARQIGSPLPTNIPGWEWERCCDLQQWHVSGNIQVSYWDSMAYKEALMHSHERQQTGTAFPRTEIVNEAGLSSSDILSLTQAVKSYAANTPDDPAAADENALELLGCELAAETIAAKFVQEVREYIVGEPTQAEMFLRDFSRWTEGRTRRSREGGTA